jgi:NAD(P)-dependent dehydrogenase (short-subunit alcohol dehydrogenase family)
VRPGRSTGCELVTQHITQQRKECPDCLSAGDITRYPTRVTDVLGPAAVFDLTGRVAVVTGASSGLGERFVRVLLAAGASVVAIARRTDRLEALAAESDAVLPWTADVADPAQVETIVPAALERFGRLDVLVNNAGLAIPAPATEETLENFRYTLEVNLTGAFHLARLAAVPMIEAGGGSVINISSMLGLVASWPIPNASYSSSKAALVGLTRDLACQWAGEGVRVNALAPGLFPSESTGDMTDEASARYVRIGCPMRRLGRPEELDGPLLFLASGASTYMTGQVVTVDGGWTAH